MLGVSGMIMAKVPKPSMRGGGFYRKQFKADQMAEARHGSLKKGRYTEAGR